MAVEVATATRKAALEHGKYIFIYNHISTNRVIYSLTRHIRPERALKQITFVGKKTVPAEIRRDLWKPLATVIFPSDFQGLVAYKKLREFRKMHEYCWEPEPGQQPPPKKERMKMLQDQKANSIADLAAVLHIQEQIGEHYKKVNHNRVEDAKHYLAIQEGKAKQRAEQAKSGQLEEFQKIVEKLEKRYERSSNEARKKGLREQLRAYRRKIMYMKLAQRELGAQAEGHGALSGALEGEVTPETMAELIRKKFPGPVPKFGWRRNILLRPSKPNVTVDGVLIKWADLTDAEHAESWPQGVMHDVMGYATSGRLAPNPNEPARGFDGRVLGWEEQSEGIEQEVDFEEAAKEAQESREVRQGEGQKKSGGIFGRLRTAFVGKQPQVLDEQPRQ